MWAPHNALFGASLQPLWLGLMALEGVVSRPGPPDLDNRRSIVDDAAAFKCSPSSFSSCSASSSSSAAAAASLFSLGAKKSFASSASLRCDVSGRFLFPPLRSSYLLLLLFGASAKSSVENRNRRKTQLNSFLPGKINERPPP